MIIVIMGSPSDMAVGNNITGWAKEFNIECKLFYASAHKSIQLLLNFLTEIELDTRPKVYITVAGLSNALSGVVDANVVSPVIACPAIDSSSPFAPFDLFSSLRMPRGVAVAVVLNPLNAVILAAKILGRSESIVAYQEYQKHLLETANE